MLTIILREDGEITLLYNMPEEPHVVVVHEREQWTDSPSVFEYTHEDNQAEYLATIRGEGFEDRNP